MIAPHPNKKLGSRWPYTTTACLGHFGRIGFHYLLGLVKFCWGVEELHPSSVWGDCLSSFHGFSKLILKDHKVRIDVGKSRKWFQDCYLFHAMIYHDLSETLGSRRLVMIKTRRENMNIFTYVVGLILENGGFLKQCKWTFFVGHFYTFSPSQGVMSEKKSSH